jgi:glycosyltransferase involved in cell wall biosynthesis
MGGVEIATLRMAEATSEYFRNVAFCLRDAAVTKSFEEAGMETITYSPPIPSLRHAFGFYQESLLVARQLRAAEIDIVHFAETKAAEHNSLAALLAGTRVVCHVRNTYPNLTLRQRLPLLPVDCFIFVSKEARRHFGISLSDRKARVIYDAIDAPDIDLTESNISVRHELGIPMDCTVIGMVARVNPQKDYFTLASAAAKILRAHPNVRFLIVGDNSRVELNRMHYEEVVRALSELGIADKFIFVGHRTDVYRLIAAMDIVVLATHREGFGLCIAEAMAMRKPVVATALGGLLEVVEHGVTGYLHEHENSQELAERIMSLIDNPEAARRLGMAGYEYVLRHFSREAFDREITAVYSEMMSR